MGLADFLEEKPNSHAREELFNYRLLYDLKLAAFVRGYHLQTYYSDVDHDGFDVILDDRDLLRKLQLKTAAKASKTASWIIHRQILRPTAYHWEELGFDFEGSCGVEGGVILMEYEARADSIDVRYFFTDIYIITAIAMGWVPRHGATVEAAANLRRELPKGGSTEKIGVASGLFVEAATPQHLLGLIGLHSEKLKNWQGRISIVTRETIGPRGQFSKEMVEQYKNEILPTLQEVSGQDQP